MNADDRPQVRGGMVIVVCLFAAMFGAGVLVGLLAAFALGWRPL